jgi:hypothetical protein
MAREYPGGDEIHGLRRTVEAVYILLPFIHRRVSPQSVHINVPPFQLLLDVEQRGDGVEEDEDAFSLGNGFRNDIDCHDDLVGVGRKSEAALLLRVKDVLRPL